MRMRRVVAWMLCLACSLCGTFAFAQPKPKPVEYISLNRNGQGLVYLRDARGNRVPEFSSAGYMGGGVAIPDAPVKVVVEPADGDDGPRIQAAIDYVAGLAADANGIRGAVLLAPGRFEVKGDLEITVGGVVLRGSGQDDNGTQLIAAGQDRRTLIRIFGKNDRAFTSQAPIAVADEYVPVGALTLRMQSVEGLRQGDSVVVTHPSTDAWINSLKMENIGYKGWLKWRVGKWDIVWDRTIAKIEGTTVTLDAPLTTELNAAHGGGTVAAYRWPGRIAQVGVENLRLISEYDKENPLDEAHSWMAITMESAQNAWVRQVTAVHFASSLVSIWETCKGVTVEDCASLDPISEVAGYRRNSFYTNGQQTLFQRCRSENGYHDFGVGYLAPGPNVFIECETRLSNEMSGPFQSWASGVLFDNCEIDSAGLLLVNREAHDAGVGWAAANCVLWNCTASVLSCYDPPGDAQNWAFGCYGMFLGDGNWQACDSSIAPRSLYAQQLLERLGQAASENLAKRAIPTGAQGAPPVTQVAAARIEALTHPPQPETHPLKLVNGWLTVDGKVLMGGKTDVAWWRGSTLQTRAAESGNGVTRWVPGRIGPGYTDDLNELTDTMRQRNQVALEHNMGLWYDRRRDDHETVRRPDANTWAPFYEMPWLRSGKGVSWMGLSKYDLTRFDPWYFGRLRQFADLCEQKGLVLINQNYFQHNILESWAHYADFGWRPAMAIQDTGFPEPPPSTSRSENRQAEIFYDLSNPTRKSLHALFFRKNLENFVGNANVIQMISFEFTGPLHFAQFWLETVAAWEKETGHRPLIGLNFTKDVQDAVLDDPKLNPAISVIDMRNWYYTANGVFAPPGGINLAPRQYLRPNSWSGAAGAGGRTSERTFAQIRDYRRRYPDKAVIGPWQGDTWTLLVAGASMVAKPRLSDERVLAAIPRMRPYEPEKGLGAGLWALADPGREYLLYADASTPLEIDLSQAPGTFSVQWINPQSGATQDAAEPVQGGKSVTLTRPDPGMQIAWLHKS